MKVIGILAVTSILAWVVNKMLDSSHKSPRRVVVDKTFGANDCSNDSTEFGAPCPFRSVSSINTDRLNTF